MVQQEMLEFYICYLNENFIGHQYRRGPYNITQINQAMDFWQYAKGTDPLRPHMGFPRTAHITRSEFCIVPTKETLEYLNKVSKKSLDISQK